ncbi:hypothetical protein B0J17DRAFT_678242 [Rhizoctonia solani]|nr:hypothetical protein B0J17DRAFT_678242 [Rhizoctonia solani]
MRSFGKLFLFLLTVIFGMLQECLAQGYPPCSIDCLGKSDVGSCSLRDNKCLCSYKPYVEGTVACFKSSCPDINDLRNAYDAGVVLCNQAGVTETLVPRPKRTLVPTHRVYPIAVGWN